MKKPSSTNKKINPQEHKTLSQMGFKREFSNDEVAKTNPYWLRLNIKHPFIKNLHIIICEDKITVWCSIIEHDSEEVIYQKRFSIDVVANILFTFNGWKNVSKHIGPSNN